MDSIPPRSHSFGEQQDSHAFPVKDEYGTFEDHLHLQSSEEEYGGSGAGDQRLSQGMDGQNLTGGDMGSSASGGDGTSSTKAPGGFTSASGSSVSSNACYRAIRSCTDDLSACRWFYPAADGWERCTSYKCTHDHR